MLRRRDRRALARRDLLGWDACKTRQINATSRDHRSAESIERAVAAANDETKAARGPLGQRERALAAQLKGARCSGNLLAALEQGGASALPLVRDRLAAIDRERTTLAALARTREKLVAVSRKVIDLPRVRTALADVRLLYEVRALRSAASWCACCSNSSASRRRPSGGGAFDHDAVVYRSSSIKSTAQLPEVAPSENWVETVVVGARPGATARKQRGKRRPSIVELLDRAEAIRAAIDCEGVSQAEVARRLSVTRARVTQLLNLLDLAPEVRAEVRRLACRGAPISERMLRPLAGRSMAVQLRTLRGRWNP